MANVSCEPTTLVQLLARLTTSERGLTTDEARARISTYGPNSVNSRQRSVVAQFALSFINPLVLILLVTSLVAAVLGQGIDAAIIVAIVVVGAVISFVQTFRSQSAIERLRNQVAPTATVLRDGKWSEQPRADLAPGDIIRLGAGDMVPADARLLQSRDLHVQQSALTGESLPVEKEAKPDADPSPPTPATPYLLFLGTSVVSGTATAVVTATGGRTSFGDIVARLAARPPETEFDRGMRRFSYLILQTVFFLVLFVMVVSVALRRDSLESLLFAVALAVGLTPEFLPMITAVTLAQGAVHMARQKVIVKHIAALQNFGSMDILCSDKTGTLTAGVVAFHQSLDPSARPSDRPLMLAVINSVHETGIKSPLDVALLAQPRSDGAEYCKLDEMPFDFERRRLSVVVSHADQRLLITKGAPESILPLCTMCEVDGVSSAWDAEARRRCEEVYRDLSAQGYRVLAVASRLVPEQSAYRVSDEHDLVLAGFVTFRDPPLEDAAAAIEDLRDDGVRVIILTGDNELVARHVCAEVGLDGSRIVLGSDIDRMTDAALAQIAEEASVFARMSPAQKNRVLLALKHRGHVVGYLGDGINDAPSLHTADVGISAAGAVDVAQAAAEVILQERSLRVLHSGILEGRKSFGNVMKYLLMGTSSNFGNMISMAGASFLLPFLPMLPTQILLNNLLYDLAQITIPTDNVDDSFIRKPRRWDISLIHRFMLYIGPISSLFDFVTFYALLQMFHAATPDRERLFHSGWFVESLATQTLVLLVIRTAGNPFASRPSRPLIISVLAIAAFGVLLPYLPGADILGLVPLPVSYLGFLVVATTAYLGLVQWIKSIVLARFLS